MVLRDWFNTVHWGKLLDNMQATLEEEAMLAVDKAFELYSINGTQHT